MSQDSGDAKKEDTPSTHPSQLQPDVIRDAPSNCRNLAPLGVGTELAEALSSYLARLAPRLRVTVHMLLTSHLAPLLDIPYLTLNQNNHADGIYPHLYQINGVGRRADVFSKALEILAGSNDLRHCALSACSGIFAAHGLLRQKRSWCRRCFDAWRASGKEIYEPLIWNIRVVEVCLLHGAYLETKCPHCRSEQFLLYRRSRPGYCTKCNKWLGGHGLGEVASDQMSRHDWIYRNVAELIRHLPDLSSAKKRPVANFLSKCVAQINDGDMTRMARQFRVPVSTLWGWIRGKNLPPIDRLLYICYATGLSLWGVASGNLPERITLTREAVETGRTKLAGRRKEFDKARVSAVLDAIVVADPKLPPPLAEIARRLDCSVMTLIKYFPDASRCISLRYRSWLKTSRKERLRKCGEIIDRVVDRLINTGVDPSAKTVAREARNPAMLIDKAFQDLWRKSLRKKKRCHIEEE